MARDYILQMKCCHSQCGEWSFYSYPTKRDYNAAKKRGAGMGWKCQRHNDDMLLTLEKLTATKTHTVGKSKQFPDLKKLFFDDVSGFMFGSSWKAFAGDFPEGTKIIETVQVILPDPSPKAPAHE